MVGPRSRHHAIYFLASLFSSNAKKSAYLFVVPFGVMVMVLDFQSWEVAERGSILRRRQVRFYFSLS